MGSTTNSAGRRARHPRCNICGVEGHQAAFCMNGSVDWANRWPRECFIIEPPQISRERNPTLEDGERPSDVKAKMRKRNVRGEERRGRGFG